MLIVDRTKAQLVKAKLESNARLATKVARMRIVNVQLYVSQENLERSIKILK